MVDIAKKQKEIEQVAKDIGLTEEQFNDIIAKVTEEMEARGIPDEQKDEYIVKRTEFALKLKIRNAGQEGEGFFIAQQRTVDYARNPRSKIEDYIKESGEKLAVNYGICDAKLNPKQFYVDPDSKQPVVPTSQDDYDALEMVEPLSEDELVQYIQKLGRMAAQKEGKMDDEGNYIYGPDAVKWKRGKIIPEHEYGGTAYGIFTMPGDTTPKMATVTLQGDVANQVLPLFKMLKIPMNVNKNKTTAQMYALTTDKQISEINDDVDYPQFDKIVRNAVPDRRLDSIDELDQFIDTHNQFNEWAVVDADIMEVGTTVSQFDSVAVRVSSSTSISMQGMNEEVTFWVPSARAKGVTETSDAVIVVKPRKRDDGVISGDLIGYYIDPLLRPFETDDVGPDGVMKPW